MQFNSRLMALALGGLLAAVAPALADNVSYTTSGTFSTTMNNVLSNGGVTLTFNNVPNALTVGLDSTPASDSLGYFQAVETAGGSLNVPAGETFTLNITQLIPGGSGSIMNSPLTGTISEVAGNFPGGNLVLSFSQTSLTVDGIHYALEDLGQNGLASNQLAIGTTTTNIEAEITGSAAPEPSSYLLTGFGALGLLAGVIRRKRQNA